MHASPEEIRKLDHRFIRHHTLPARVTQELDDRGGAIGVRLGLGSLK